MIPNFNYKQNLKFSFDKILFIMACAYLVAVIFGLMSQGKLKLPGITPSSKQATSQTQTPSLDNEEFIAYLQKSLEILERKQQQPNPNPPSNPIPTQAIKIPPPPVNSASAPQIIEKIYVPVYPQVQQPQTLSVNPPIATPPTQVQIPSPPPLPVPNQLPIQPPKPPSTVPVLTPPEVSALPQTVPPSVSSSNNALLVGLLEAGDKSSALFTVDGQTRRIQLGEVIGTTGWMLKSVENQQVLISRNGAVRALQVGQNF
ncbi:conserved hypothetical protein [Gloeothece citriformis PCC 7424]|uniref:Type II secretion system protein GspC N-terminal domain-containing protein n=1 Tax=Gloeothece citriformis (strain PCC 7424) TaxID=65393 RepID=B7KA32_GLOC7|nr:hypothetical protein [Gloeothece citriformis]ACK71388.1 conserved hypothetical protein [Gloeothece citriformis PCC 7424]